MLDISGSTTVADVRTVQVMARGIVSQLEELNVHFSCEKGSLDNIFLVLLVMCCV